MKHFITEHGLTMFYAIVSMIILTVGFSFYKIVSFDSFYSDNIYGTELRDNEELSSEEKPVLEIQELVILDVSETYDYTRYIIKAENSNGENLKDDVSVYYIGRYDAAGLNMSVPGTRTVRYKLTYNGVSTMVEQIVIVKNKGVIE